MSPENPQGIQPRYNLPSVHESDLLASQQALLKLASGGTQYRQLNALNLRTFGTLLAVDMLAVAGELEDKDQREAIQQKLWYTASGLIAPTRPNGAPKGAHSTAGDYLVLDGYDHSETTGYHTGHPAYTGPGIFTPTGIALDSEGPVKQSIVEVKFTISDETVADTYRSRTRFKSYLRLYTDNLAATPPTWEFRASTTHSNIFPTRTQHNPYSMHAVPERFTDDEQALTVIEKLTRAVTSR